MKMEIISSKENPLLERTEVTAKVSGYEATPDRNALAQEIAKAVKAEKERIFILKVEQHYGATAARVEAQVYATPEALAKTVHKKRMLRGKPTGEKKEEKPAAAPKQHKAEEKKEEKAAKTPHPPAQEKKEAPASRGAEEKAQEKN